MTIKTNEPLGSLIKKYWIAVVGAFFFLLGILYLLKVLFEEIEIPPWLKLSLGIFAGFTGMAGGFKLHSLTYRIPGETVSGFGLAAVYASVAWGVVGGILKLPELALLLILCGFSIAVIVLSSGLRMRILSLLGLVGGLWSGFLIEHQARDASILPIAVYLLSLNATGIFMSFRSSWAEFRIVPFFMTILAILVTHSSDYIGKFSHGPAQAWFLLLSFSLMYHYAFFYRWVTDLVTMSPTNHYLNATNMLFLLTGSVALVRWVHVPSAWPLAGVAIWLYGSGLFLRKKDAGSHTSLYFILASVLFALSAFSFNTLVHTPGMYHAVRSAVWGILVLVLLLTGIRLKSDTFALSAFGIFLYAMVYWYGTAWSVEWVPVLGFKYIPFINPGGLVWIFYAAIGLGFSFYFKSRNDAKTLGGLGMSPRSLHLAALFLAHIIIMGLLTIQTSNVWDAYQLHSGMVRVTWVHSVIWTAYSLILFFTASQTHEKFFSTAASILLLATSIKVIFHDLQGQTNLVRALFLLAIGGLMMSIAWLLQKRLRDK